MSQLQVTQLLDRLRQGDDRAWEDLIPLVYEEMREIARHHRQGERRGHTLQTTALVHEAYLRLQPSQRSWESRSHFLAAAAVAVRRTLIDHARKKDRIKRGGGREILSLHDADGIAPRPAFDLIALSDAIDRLGELDERPRRVVEMKYFGGMTIAQIAEVLGVSESTVEGDWRVARMWLRRALGDERDEPR